MLQKFETQNVILLKVPFGNFRKIYNFDARHIKSYKIDNKEKGVLCLNLVHDESNVSLSLVYESKLVSIVH